MPVGASPTGGDNDEYWLDYEIAAASCRLGRAYRRITDWNVVRPTGGSYDNPHPVEEEWSAEPTSVNNILWYSERLFTEDGRNQADEHFTGDSYWAYNWDYANSENAKESFAGGWIVLTMDT